VICAVKSMPEFSTARKHKAAFDTAMASLTSGDIAWGHTILAAEHPMDAPEGV